MALPEQFLMELAERNDIESVISSYVDLKHRGRTLVGLCPFHGEKTASFTVYPETASYYCFGCGAGGDVITFIKQIENLDYLDAVKLLAERAGMTMPEDSKRDDAVGKLRMRILEANREAARYFHSCLFSEVGKEALEYFHRRGYSDKTIHNFGLGYAPDSFNSLRDALRGKGFNDEELTAAFLCKRGERSVYDVFRNRVMVPIIDVRGNVIAFGGRVLDNSKPKYVNTSDTLAFKKSRNLFALNYAKANASEELIVCEGYMDVIAMHQAGITNAVAALGTAFTPEHASLLARYTKSVVLLYDSDEAGQKAAKRTIEILRPTGLNVRVVSVPEGKDPDEFIKKNGVERFRAVLRNSSSDVEYQLMELAKQSQLNTAVGKTEFLSAAAKVLAKLDNPIECEVYASKLASDMQIPKNVLMMQIESERKKKSRFKSGQVLREAVRNEQKAIAQVNPDATQHERAAKAEERLLGLFILHPDYLTRVKDSLPADTFVTSFNREFYSKLCSRLQEGKSLELTQFSSEYDEKSMGYLSKMLQEARMLEGNLEELDSIVSVLKEEKEKLSVSNTDTLSDEDILAYMQSLKDKQKSND